MLAAAFAAATALSASAAAVATLEPQSGVGFERGVAFLRCKTGPRSWRTSRGAILDLDLRGADRDVILTTAHGLPASQNAVPHDCRVLGARGESYRIEYAWRGTGEDHDGIEDWAVLLVRRRVGGDVGRLRVAQVTPDGLLRLAAQQAPVRLVRTADAGDCNLYPFADAALEARPGSTLFFYSCPTAPGLSGSPILASIEGRPLLIAIHVGWSIRAVDHGLRPAAVGRPIDAEIVSAMSAASTRARRSSHDER